MSGWVCQWKPFQIPVGDSFKKAFVEEWVFISDEPSDGQNIMDVPLLHSTDHSDCIPGTARISKQCDFSPCEPTKPQDKAYFWERIETPLPPCGHGPNATSYIHDSSVPFPNAWSCDFSSDEILLDYEDIVSSGTEQFTVWVKLSPHEVLTQHMVDTQRATADFSETSERRPEKDNAYDKNTRQLHETCTLSYNQDKLQLTHLQYLSVEHSVRTLNQDSSNLPVHKIFFQHFSLNTFPFFESVINACHVMQSLPEHFLVAHCDRREKKTATFYKLVFSRHPTFETLNRFFCEVLTNSLCSVHHHGANKSKQPRTCLSQATIDS